MSLSVTDAKFYKSTPNEKTRVVAYVVITVNDSMKIYGLKMREGKHGNFITWPEYRINQNKYHPVVIPDKVLRNKINDNIMLWFRQNGYSTKEKYEAETVKN